MDLETYLKENKITKTAFAKKIGIHRSYLSNYIHKKMAFGKFLSEKIVIETNGEVSYASLRQSNEEGELFKKHPWGEFLEARKKVIIWMREEKQRTDKEIAKHLSMDEMQVYLIGLHLEEGK
jgi:DNA-binding transcriptional regulator YdaS (Cro superfamily)